MATFDADCIRGMIKKYFGKHAKKSWKALVSDFLYVLYGVKNGFLYDYGKTDADTIIDFLEDFRNLLAVDAHVGLGPGLVVVIEIGGDIVIASPKLIIPFLKNCLEQVQPLYIDVSGKLERPVLCTEDFISVNITNDLVKSLKNILDLKADEKSKTNNACNADLTLIKKLKFDVTETCNISTVYGILIGYPVLYWYNNVDTNNCLGMIPLRVYTVKCNVRLRDVINDKFTMYSFSVPDSLVSCFEENISVWFGDLQSRVKRLENNLFTELELYSEVVILPTLAL